MSRSFRSQNVSQRRSISSLLRPSHSAAHRPSTVAESDNSDDHIVPDGTKDVLHISYLRFVRMFMSGKLVLPNDLKERHFGFEDLRDLGEIGRGRYGRVNKMIYIPIGMPIAVKSLRLLMNKFDDSDDTRLMKQLQNEVRAIQDASTCPEVVCFYGLTFNEGDLLICMELMDLSLERLYKIVHNMTKEGFDENVFGIIAVSVLSALNNLKRLKHIIHRDVKPSNILLNAKGQIKLCDFGISGYLEDSIARTKNVGCRPYMAPERLMAAQEEYDIRTDVWSLGITLIEVARGEFPYPNFNDKCIFAQLQQVVCGDPLFMNPNDNYTLKTVQFVNMCLTKEYLDRPTYEDLMQTEFFTFFNTLKQKEKFVKVYVQKMLSIAGDHMQPMHSSIVSSAATKIGKSVMDVAANSGLLTLSPSDLVFESSQYGIAYYDFVLSVTEFHTNENDKCSVNFCTDFTIASTSACSPVNHASTFDHILPTSIVNDATMANRKGYQLFLAKLDAQTNVEWFETAKVPFEVLSKNNIPATELAIIIMGVLIWRNTLSKSRLLCLVNQLNDDNSIALEALKRATNKFKCSHHVLTIGARRASSTLTCSSCSTCSYRSSVSSTSAVKGMKLRVMMCQSQTELIGLPSQAIRETKFLLVPSSNPLLCFCFRT